MDRLLVFALVGMLSSISFANVENFQELIDTASKEQSEAHRLVTTAATRPVKKAPATALKNSDFKIKLVKLRLKKRTMVATAGSKKPLNQRRLVSSDAIR